MSQTSSKETKTQIMKGFEQLMSDRSQMISKVATKEEEVEKEKNKQLLEKTANYTIDNIVNGMATLQLDFGEIVHQLAEKLTTESAKLDELKQAIKVEQYNLAELKKIRLVADALYLLRQENQEKVTNLENRINNQQEILNKEITQNRKIWEKEQKEFEAKVTEARELLEKQREQEKADYQYQIQRERKIEMDEYEEAKRLQERELAENNQDKEKVWQEREKFLSDNKAEFEENKKQIATFEEKLKKAYTDAKVEAIKEAEKEAKVKADLIEKEWEATKQGYELKIQSLEATIQKQTEQITDLITQLQTVTSQAQNLATRAFQGNGNS